MYVYIMCIYIYIFLYIFVCSMHVYLCIYVSTEIISMCSCGYKHMDVSTCVYVCYWFAKVFRWVCAFDRPNNTEGISVSRYALVYGSVDSYPEGSEKQQFPHAMWLCKLRVATCGAMEWGSQVFWRVTAVLNDPSMKYGDISLFAIL